MSDKYLKFISMDTQKQTEILTAVKSEIDSIQNSDYDNFFIRKRLDHLEEMYTNLKNRVNIKNPAEDSKFNEINKLISRDSSRTEINPEDKI